LGFQEFVRLWLSTLPITGRELPDQLFQLSSESLKKTQVLLRFFWNGYIKGVQKNSKEINDLLIRSTKFCAARMLQSTFESLHSQTELNNFAVYMLQISINIITNIYDAIIHLLGIPFKPEL
jgi:hypothetical protein